MNPRSTRKCPAKINLGLRITGRRDDGYHLLESVFAPIDLYDELEIELLEGPDSVELSLREAPDGDLPEALRAVTAGADNLVVQAAEAFRAATGLSGQIRLRLTKAIPVGAGLGGGSSDAAGVLLGLSELAPEAAARVPCLPSLALKLGADVPFFLDPCPAWVTGIGEEIEPIAKFPALDLVIANPGISVATAEVYRVVDELPDSLTGSGAGSTMRAISRLCGENDDWAPALGDLLVNHLEPAAISLCPEIGRLVDRIRGVGAVGVSQSGSGATVFGVFESSEQAKHAADRLCASADSASPIWARVTRVITDRS